MLLKADLHIHTCLSPCASLEMSPSLIADILISRGINIAAVTDHNSALNCPAFAQACAGKYFLPLFGIEVNSIEEAHLLCIFRSSDDALDFGSFIYEKIPDVKNDPERFGDQVYVDADENILGEVEKYLGSSVMLSMNEIMDEVYLRGGLFIPAHIDKPVFSVTSQLGFLPEENYSAVEVFNASALTGSAAGPAIAKYREKYCVITSSDAHFPDDIGKSFFEIDLEELSFDALAEGLKQRKAVIPAIR